MLKQVIAAAKALNCNTIVFSDGLTFCCKEEEATHATLGACDLRLHSPYMLIPDESDYDPVPMKSVDINGNYTLMRLK